jgi:glyoxylase-like metal-dependent hydrolase (beta-lactamase superfamily II)
MSDVSPRLSVTRFAGSETGAWSNSYLVCGDSQALLFDVVQLRSDAIRLADTIEQSGRTLTTVMISHAHPDHFLGLDVIVDRFPRARVVATRDVVADLKTDGPWMFSLLKAKLGPEGPSRLVMPETLTEQAILVDGAVLDVVEFGEGESKHMGCLYAADTQAFLAADLIYDKTHLYLQERHLESWLDRLDEFEIFAEGRVSTIYPGHGDPSDLSLTVGTRSYLRDFAEAVRAGDAASAERRMRDRYPEHRVEQFLSLFSIPAYFPPEATTEP